jgi:hypothetical protein
MVAPQETAELAEPLIAETVARHHLPPNTLTLHADRGSRLRSKPVAALLVGEEAKGLSPAVVSRLKAQGSEDYLAWNRRDLSGEHYVYGWADGIYSTPRGRG